MCSETDKITKANSLSSTHHPVTADHCGVSTLRKQGFPERAPSHSSGATGLGWYSWAAAGRRPALSAVTPPWGLRAHEGPLSAMGPAGERSPGDELHTDAPHEAQGSRGTPRCFNLGSLPGRPEGRRATHSVCPRQKDAMLCGATAQLTRIFSSRSAVRTKRSSGLTACAEGTDGSSGWPEPTPSPPATSVSSPQASHADAPHLQHLSPPPLPTSQPPCVQPVTESW